MKKYSILLFLIAIIFIINFINISYSAENITNTKILSDSDSGHKITQYRHYSDKKNSNRIYSKGVTNTSNVKAVFLNYEALPSKGSPKIPVILVDFSDYPRIKSQTVNKAFNDFFGSGNADNYPFNSLTHYYYRSSYKKLIIKGNILGWYRAKYKRSYYTNKHEALIKEAVAYFNKKGVDFRPYDNDNNGVMEGLYLIWTGPSGGEESEWWPMCESFYGTPIRVDGKILDQYIWSWFSEYDRGSSPSADLDIATIAHETGHLLGLPDLYDYDPSQGPKGGVGGLDLMDDCFGDINCFFKYLLGWINPIVISNGSKTVKLRPSSVYPDAVLIKKGYVGNKYSEYFMVQYRKRIGNDIDYPGNGLVIWHVDAILNRDTGDFLYDNSYTNHKLLRIMEADGLEEIEKSDFYVFQAQDYYNNHKNFGYTTRPSSRTYRGLNTHITVTNISKPGITIQAKYAIDFTAPQITANINGGTYYQPFYVTLKSSDLGNIYYTMNNSTPTVLSPKYLNPLKISKTTTLKFFTIDLAGNKSNLYTRKYILN